MMRAIQIDRFGRASHGVDDVERALAAPSHCTMIGKPVLIPNPRAAAGTDHTLPTLEIYR